MIFTSFTYLVFLVVVLAVYWSLARWRRAQNLFLLAASYLFYGWVHPWFLSLIAFATAVGFAAAVGIERWPGRKRLILVASLVANLGLLAIFKYFDFFVDSLAMAITTLGGLLGLVSEGRSVGLPLLGVLLPVGISFFTFQVVAATVDVYRGKVRAQRDPIDYALFIAFFPQLVAGPIERSHNLMRQVSTARVWRWDYLPTAAVLLARGYVKKLVIADNLAVYVDKVFMHASPGVALLLAGGVVFAFQIYADFSAYTDIARGSGRLLGFELLENFRSPYLAVSPSDHWRRWHITFSTLIRDYLYIPLGGSRARSALVLLGVLLLTMGLSGLWHGAAWHFVAWGLYHGLLLWGAHRLGFAGRWRPASRWGTLVAVVVTFTLIVVGWLLFRAPNLQWLFDALWAGGWGSFDQLVAALVIVAATGLYASPLLLMRWVGEGRSDDPAPLVFRPWWHWKAAAGMVLLLLILLLYRQDAGQDFIYFAF